MEIDGKQWSSDWFKFRTRHENDPQGADVADIKRSKADTSLLSAGKKLAVRVELRQLASKVASTNKKLYYNDKRDLL